MAIAETDVAETVAGEAIATDEPSGASPECECPDLCQLDHGN